MIRQLLELDRSAWLLYARAHLVPSSIGWRNEAPDEALLERVGAPGAVLDAGCGAGRHTIALARLGWRATGIDLFRRPLAEARRRARGTNASFFRGSVTNLGEHFLADRFDLVIDVLGPASDLTRAGLRKYAMGLSSVLRPQGTLLVFTFLDAKELETLFVPFDQVEVDGVGPCRWLAARRSPRP